MRLKKGANTMTSSRRLLPRFSVLLLLLSRATSEGNRGARSLLQDDVRSVQANSTAEPNKSSIGSSSGSPDAFPGAGSGGTKELEGGVNSSELLGPSSMGLGLSSRLSAAALVVEGTIVLGPGQLVEPCTESADIVIRTGSRPEAAIAVAVEVRGHFKGPVGFAPADSSLAGGSLLRMALLASEECGDQLRIGSSWIFFLQAPSFEQGTACNWIAELDCQTGPLLRPSAEARAALVAAGATFSSSFTVDSVTGAVTILDPPVYEELPLAPPAPSPDPEEAQRALENLLRLSQPPAPTPPSAPGVKVIEEIIPGSITSEIKKIPQKGFLIAIGVFASVIGAACIYIRYRQLKRAREEREAALAAEELAFQAEMDEARRREEAERDPLDRELDAVIENINDIEQTQGTQEPIARSNNINGSSDGGSGSGNTAAAAPQQAASAAPTSSGRVLDRPKSLRSLSWQSFSMQFAKMKMAGNWGTGGNKTTQHTCEPAPTDGESSAMAAERLPDASEGESGGDSAIIEDSVGIEEAPPSTEGIRSEDVPPGLAAHILDSIEEQDEESVRDFKGKEAAVADLGSPLSQASTSDSSWHIPAPAHDVVLPAQLEEVSDSPHVETEMPHAAIHQSLGSGQVVESEAWSQAPQQSQPALPHETGFPQTANANRQDMDIDLTYWQQQYMQAQQQQHVFGHQAQDQLQNYNHQTFAQYQNQMTVTGELAEQQAAYALQLQMLQRQQLQQQQMLQETMCSASMMPALQQGQQVAQAPAAKASQKSTKHAQKQGSTQKKSGISWKEHRRRQTKQLNDQKRHQAAIAHRQQQQEQAAMMLQRQMIQQNLEHQRLHIQQQQMLQQEQLRYQAVEASSPVAYSLQQNSPLQHDTWLSSVSHQQGPGVEPADNQNISAPRDLRDLSLSMMAASNTPSEKGPGMAHELEIGTSAMLTPDKSAGSHVASAEATFSAAQEQMMEPAAVFTPPVSPPVHGLANPQNSPTGISGNQPTRHSKHNSVSVINDLLMSDALCDLPADKDRRRASLSTETCPEAKPASISSSKAGEGISSFWPLSKFRIGPKSNRSSAGSDSVLSEKNSRSRSPLAIRAESRKSAEDLMREANPNLPSCHEIQEGEIEVPDVSPCRSGTLSGHSSMSGPYSRPLYSGSKSPSAASVSSMVSSTLSSPEESFSPNVSQENYSMNEAFGPFSLQQPEQQLNSNAAQLQHVMTQQVQADSRSDGSVALGVMYSFAESSPSLREADAEGSIALKVDHSQLPGQESYRDQSQHEFPSQPMQTFIAAAGAVQQPMSPYPQAMSPQQASSMYMQLVRHMELSSPNSQLPQKTTALAKSRTSAPPKKTNPVGSKSGTRKMPGSKRKPAKQASKRQANPYTWLEQQQKEYVRLQQQNLPQSGSESTGQSAQSQPATPGATDMMQGEAIPLAAAQRSPINPIMHSHQAALIFSPEGQNALLGQPAAQNSMGYLEPDGAQLQVELTVEEQQERQRQLQILMSLMAPK